MEGSLDRLKAGMESENVASCCSEPDIVFLWDMRKLHNGSTGMYLGGRGGGGGERSPSFGGRYVCSQECMPV